MKYFRFKLVGFGLAVLGGSVLAADDGQLPANGKRPESEKVVQNSPGQTRTATVQFNASVGSLHAADPLWFSASKSGIAPIPVSSANSGAIPASALGVAAASEKVQTAGSHSTQTVVECSCASPTTGIGEPAAFSPREMGMWSLQPLPPQLLVPWKRSTGQLESWPPTGPLIGTVPPGLLSPGDLPPISEPPGNSKVVRDPVPAVSSPPEVWSQPLNNTPRPNALTRPVPLENQATPPVMTKPQPTPPLPSQAPVVTQSTPPPGTTADAPITKKRAGTTDDTTNSANATIAHAANVEGRSGPTANSANATIAHAANVEERSDPTAAGNPADSSAAPDERVAPAANARLNPSFAAGNRRSRQLPTSTTSSCARIYRSPRRT